jgi:hypothetical protein
MATKLPKMDARTAARFRALFNPADLALADLVQLAQVCEQQGIELTADQVRRVRERIPVRIRYWKTLRADARGHEALEEECDEEIAFYTDLDLRLRP